MLSKPLLLFDGECGFCRRWIERWRKKAQGTVDFKPYQEVLNNFPQVSEAACEKAVQLVLPDGSVISGAHAVFKALGFSGNFYRSLDRLYDRLPLFGKLSEKAYQWVSDHRSFLSKFS